MIWWIVGIIGAVALFIIIGRAFSKEGSEDIFSRGAIVVKKFKDCCWRFKKMLGGGA